MFIIFTVLSMMCLIIKPIYAVTSEDLYNEGYSRGYNAGYILALVNNAIGKHTPYNEIPRPSRDQVFNENMDYLHDKENVDRSPFYTGYLKGREDGYNAYIGKDGSDEVEVQDGKVFGGVFGLIYGEIRGIKDYREGKNSDWLKAIPKDAELTTQFDLKKLSAEERTRFINEFKLSFQKGYESAYINEMFGINRESFEKGEEDGVYFGEIFGNIYGTKDYFEGRNLDYNRNMPSDEKIKNEYALTTDRKEYIEAFLSGFKKAFREAYLNSYRDARNNIIELEESNAYENGYEVGEIRGIMQGKQDYINGKTSNWLRAKPSTSSIINDYNLIYQNQKYMDSFINGFWDGYSKGYTETYKELSQKDAMNKVTSIIVPIEGGIVRSSDNSMFVQIEKGTYYRENIVNIEVVSNSTKFDSKYIIASNSYKVYVVNPSGEYNPDKKVLISFEYYGDNNAGIYIQKNGRWVYLESKINNNSIITSIDPSLISGDGNVFTVLVDKEFVNFYDIRGHWAKDEIDTLVRKGIINGYPDKTFRPDKYITRAEFIVLLSRAYEWELPSDLSNISIFKDRSSFSVFNEKQISYALSRGYINGYPDNYFRPGNYISYKEVEIIMRRILGNNNFTWDSYANKMIYDKKVRSSSFDSMSNHITRAEFAYLLYELMK